MVHIYTTKSCPSCMVAKQYMTKNNIPFKEVNVETEFDDFMEVYNATQVSAVPQFKLGKDYIVGFNPKAISEYAETL